MPTYTLGDTVAFTARPAAVTNTDHNNEVDMTGTSIINAETGEDTGFVLSRSLERDGRSWRESGECFTVRHRVLGTPVLRNSLYTTEAVLQEFADVGETQAESTAEQRYNYWLKTVLEA